MSYFELWYEYFSSIFFPQLFLQHLIWLLRRDGDTHEYRRHLGHGKVVQTDLIPMLIEQTEENEISDVLLRLLLNLTTPALYLYNETPPKDGPNRRNFLDLIEILQSFKAAFSVPAIWISLRRRLQKVLEIVRIHRKTIYVQMKCDLNSITI